MKRNVIKLAALCSAVMLAVGTLAACGAAPEENTPKSAETQQETDTASDTNQ